MTNMQAFLNALPVIGKGILGVFAVIAVIYVLIALLQGVYARKEKDR